MISGFNSIKRSFALFALITALFFRAAFCFAQDSASIKRPSCVYFGEKGFLAGIEYPSEARDFCIKGVTIVRFMVDTAGKVSDMSISKGVSPVLDNHVQQILNKSSGYWKSGTINGRPTAMWMSMVFDYHIYTTRSDLLFSSGDNTLLETIANYNNDVLSISYLGHTCLLDELGYYNKGVKLYSKGKTDEALTFFETACRLNYNDYHALFNCAIIYINRNEPAKACQYLQKVQRTGGKDVSEMITKFCATDTY